MSKSVAEKAQSEDVRQAQELVARLKDILVAADSAVVADATIKAAWCADARGAMATAQLLLREIGELPFSRGRTAAGADLRHGVELLAGLLNVQSPDVRG